MIWNEIKHYITVATVIIFGAIANSMQLLLENSTTEKKNKTADLIANFILASFGWLIAWLIAKLVIDDVIRITVIAWIGGYAGVSGLNKIKDVLLDTLINLIQKKQW